MTMKERVKRRSEELMKQGIEPEAAVAIAVAEEIKKQEAEDAEKQKNKNEIEGVIIEGKKAVKDLKDLHHRLENEANE